jgi:hypothetical protein
VPLCRLHHRAVHGARDEQAWWRTVGVDPDQVARNLWKDTRIEEGRTELRRRPQAAVSDRTAKPTGEADETQAPP